MFLRCCRILVVVSLLLCLFSNNTKAQKERASHQLWWDATAFRSFAVDFRKVLTVGTRHLLSGDKDWNKLVIRPGLEWYPIPWIDVFTGLMYMGTQEKIDQNTTEWRPDLGLRLNFLQQTMTLRSTNRIEYRHVKTRETNEVSDSWRFRTRIELLVPINNKSKRDPKTLYALTDFEFFVDIGEKVEERYANRNRFRLGLGWRFDAQWRTELVYLLQNSRNNLEQEDPTQENIYWLKVKYQPLRKRTKKQLKEQPHI